MNIGIDNQFFVSEGTVGGMLCLLCWLHMYYSDWFGAGGGGGQEQGVCVYVVQKVYTELGWYRRCLPRTRI
jgi:hypothetical protein